MAFLAWSDELSVNIKEIDGQHKGLVDMLNQLHGALLAGKGSDILGKILSDMIDYSRIHFATEEHYMTEYDFPGYVHHKKEHDTFAARALDLQDAYAKSPAAFSVTVFEFLKDWLSKHIMGTDKKYGPFLNSKGIF